MKHLYLLFAILVFTDFYIIRNVLYYISPVCRNIYTLIIDKFTIQLCLCITREEKSTVYHPLPNYISIVVLKLQTYSWNKQTNENTNANIITSLDFDVFWSGCTFMCMRWTMVTIMQSSVLNVHKISTHLQHALFLMNTIYIVLNVIWYDVNYVLAKFTWLQLFLSTQTIYTKLDHKYT